MSDELTQLEVARKVLADFMFEAFRSSDQGAKKIKEAHKALDLLLAITPPGEADTKPLVSQEDVALVDTAMGFMSTLATPEWISIGAAWSRIRQALHTHGEADKILALIKPTPTDPTHGGKETQP